MLIMGWRVGTLRTQAPPMNSKIKRTARHHKGIVESEGEKGPSPKGEKLQGECLTSSRTPPYEHHH